MKTASAVKTLLLTLGLSCILTALAYSCVHDKVVKPATALEQISLRPNHLDLTLGESKSVRIVTVPEVDVNRHSFEILLPEEQNVIEASIIEQGKALKISGLALGQIELTLRTRAENPIQTTMQIRVEEAPEHPKPAIESVEFPNQGNIPASFINKNGSPVFHLTHLDPQQHRYLSIIMVDHFGKPGIWTQEIQPRWLHWEQRDVFIQNLISTQGNLTVASTAPQGVPSLNWPFNASNKNNLSYFAMQPPINSGMHRYDFYFILHKTKKNIQNPVHNNNLGEDGAQYLDQFLQNFTAEDIIFNVWGIIDQNR